MLPHRTHPARAARARTRQNVMNTFTKQPATEKTATCIGFTGDGKQGRDGKDCENESTHGVYSFGENEVHSYGTFYAWRRSIAIENVVETTFV